MGSYDSIFKAYDVRGTVPDQFDVDMARSIGAAFAKFARDREGATRILVARDMRPSGVEMTKAFTEGATGQGLDVIDLGLTSTDLIYFASGVHDAPGAMFTASHNPAQYNGIKFCLRGAKPVIPNKSNRVALHPFNRRAYKGRNVIERCFCRLKDFRRIATRYDKLARNFLAAVHLAALVAYWLN